LKIVLSVIYSYLFHSKPYNCPVVEQAARLRPQDVEVAALNLDQQVVADNIDDVAAEAHLEPVARPRQVLLQRGVEGALGELADAG
jgi:hypothetical protein